MNEAQWKVQKSNYLPKLDLGYTRQAVDGQSGFYAWEAGISVPLLFFSQKGKTKAAQLDYHIAAQNFDRQKLELNAAYNEQLSRFQVLQEVLGYYRDEALPLAEEQMQAANISYRLGSIDYVQFIQNMETALKTQQDYLQREAEYLELAARLKYLTTNN